MVINLTLLKERYTPFLNQPVYILRHTFLAASVDIDSACPEVSNWSCNASFPDGESENCSLLLIRKKFLFYRGTMALRLDGKAKFTLSLVIIPTILKLLLFFRFESIRLMLQTCTLLLRQLCVCGFKNERPFSSDRINFAVTNPLPILTATNICNAIELSWGLDVTICFCNC